VTASPGAAARRRFSLRSAFDAADAGEAEPARWVGDFLASRGSGNAALAAARRAHCSRAMASASSSLFIFERPSMSSFRARS